MARKFKELFKKMSPEAQKAAKKKAASELRKLGLPHRINP
jgi:hypothetical protein